MFSPAFSQLDRPGFCFDPAADLGTCDSGIEQLLHPRAIAKVWHHRLSVCHRTHELTVHTPLFAKHVLPGFDHALTAGVAPIEITDRHFSLWPVPSPSPLNEYPEIPVHDPAPPRT